MQGPIFLDIGWSDYLYWQSEDKKTLNKINKLIRDIMRDPYDGAGHPEPLKHDQSGKWSRRIDTKNRLIYRILDDGTLAIYQCKGHYQDK